MRRAARCAEWAAHPNGTSLRGAVSRVVGIHAAAGGMMADPAEQIGGGIRRTRRPCERSRAKREPIPPAARRAAVAGFVGTFIEYYDYAIFAVLTVYLAPLFFPASNPAMSLLAGLAVYGVGFVARPLGGIVFGRIGDRQGRRAALMLTIGLMGGCTVLMGLLPTYRTIGVFAPVLLVLLRLTQGLSAGSEMLGSITYVIESAPASRRALLASLTSFGAALGGVAGGAMALVVGVLVPHDDMISYGWRIPFLVAAPLSLVAFLLRKRVEDTPAFFELAKTEQIAKSPLREAVVHHWPQMLVASALAIAANGPASVSNFFVTYLVGSRHLPFATVMLAFTISTLIGALTLPLAGSLSDRFGCRRMLAYVFAAFIVLCVPILLLLASARGPILLGVGMTAYLVLVEFLAVPTWNYVALLFPSRARFTGSTFGANVGALLTGSTGGLVAGWLVFVTGSLLGPVIWIGGWSLFGLSVLAASAKMTSDVSAAPEDPSGSGEGHAPHGAAQTTSSRGLDERRAAPADASPTADISAAEALR